MEKVVAALWAQAGESREDFGARIVETLPAAMRMAGASAIRINIRDAAVAPAADLVQQWQAPQQDAVVQFWLPSANALFRAAIDDVLAQASGHFAAWLVCESTIIANTAHSVAAGERTSGWSQTSFIAFRPDMTHADAVAHWHSHHTRAAIDTQTNFEYVQNLIVRPLTDGAPAYDAFVEECFPVDAMTVSEVFYDAVGNPTKYEANLAAMMDSCAGFIDFTRIDIIPTSQFDFTEDG